MVQMVRSSQILDMFHLVHLISEMEKTIGVLQGEDQEFS